jgi:small-conductance mechanosensitive channel
MSTVISQAWFWPALLIVIGLPLALVVLNEVHGSLVRRGSSYAKSIVMLRNWLLPASAAYLLISQLNHAGDHPVPDATLTKIAATVVGFFVMLLLLSGANAALFGEAESGSWRQRLPGIFIDLGRLILIIIGIGILLSWVWGANIGGLITAVGVTSVVIGLAVQNAVGPILAGLLLLFEQPFGIGDWLDTKFGKGFVVEVNWRAVHIDTGNGLQIVPNAALAGDAFVNLSRTTSPLYQAKATLAFAPDDKPGDVRSTLLAVADALPAKLADHPAKVVELGAGSYRVSVPIASPADESAATSMLFHRAWYAGQRAGLHLDGVVLRKKEVRDYLAEHVQAIADSLGLHGEAVSTMLAAARILPFTDGEIMQQAGSVPKAMGFITAGVAGLFVNAADGRRLSLSELGPGDYIGGASLTRQRMITGVVALTEVVIVEVSREAMNTVVQQDHRLARQIGDAIDIRRRTAREALAEAAAGVR